MSLLKWVYNAKAHIRQPIVDNLLYGLELDVRALYNYPNKSKFQKEPEPDLRVIPVYGPGLIADLLDLHGMDRLKAARLVFREGSVGINGLNDHDITWGRFNLTDEQINERMWCLPRADFLVEIEQGEDFVLYDMVGMCVDTRRLRKFAKDNFESYRYKKSPGERFLPLYFGRSQALRIDATDLTLRALIGKRISKENLTGHVE